MMIYANGRIIDEKEASVSPFDHGFLYGLGVFETFRTYNGHPFLLDDHFHRLGDGLREMNIHAAPYSRAETTEVITDLLSANGLRDAYFRWNVSAGEGPVGLRTEAYNDPNTFVFVKELPDTLPGEKHLRVLSQRRNTPEGPERLKSHHYLNSILGKREAGGHPDTEGLFLTAEGRVAEGVVSNVFWSSGRTLYTPAVSCGILNGITRRYVMTLARDLGFSVKEGEYRLDDLLSADEVFVTNSIQEAAAVCAVEDCTFPGRRGEVYRKISERYREEALSGQRWTGNTE
ncbi:aminodeoxychorismate lyase [Alteribacter natronophilus]|uniref:aminodeoxychorismate lyase n=1 Tax=Alteribacter natronophilus TaxID=2583810 RepID=UPI00110D3481|nr:aminodeoxychorismate lyase [Alteribacter natronophilus]TMW69934.1 aminodeoxychorismate lyase [Alteribacter natronophilus]